MGDFFSSTSRKKYYTTNKQKTFTGSLENIGGNSIQQFGDNPRAELTTYDVSNTNTSNYSLSKIISPIISIMSGSPDGSQSPSQTIGGLGWKSWALVGVIAVILVWIYKRS